MALAFHKYQDQDTMEFTSEFNAFSEAVIAAGCGDFDCEQVANAMDLGWTPFEAAYWFNRDYAEDNQVEDYEDRMNHDMSMNT